MSALITVDSLAEAIESGQSVHLLDVRWRLDEPEGRPAYLTAHLPGAVYVDLERELARPGHPEEGRHPLPSVHDLQRSARRWGVRQEDVVVVYDDNDGVAAARAWWLLRRHGLDVRVLDGGFRAWVAAGHLLERGDRAVTPGDVILRDDPRDTISIDEAALFPATGVLVDVRAPEHYRGSAGGLDPETGHIPGAINIPTVSHISAEGHLRTPDEIRTTLRRFGIDSDRPVALYCGSGIASAHSALAFHVAGVETKIFTGSWSLWSRSPGRPVAVGTAPFDRVRSA